jgi:hypothetical protein
LQIADWTSRILVGINQCRGIGARLAALPTSPNPKNSPLCGWISFPSPTAGSADLMAVPGMLDANHGPVGSVCGSLRQARLCSFRRRYVRGKSSKKIGPQSNMDALVARAKAGPRAAPLDTVSRVRNSLAYAKRIVVVDGAFDSTPTARPRHC